MRWKEAEKRISLYLMEDLPEGEKEEVEFHFQVCQRCEEELHHTLLWEGKLRSLFQGEGTPQGLAEQIIQSLGTSLPPLKRRETTVVNSPPQKNFLWTVLASFLLGFSLGMTLLWCLF